MPILVIAHFLNFQSDKLSAPSKGSPNCNIFLTYSEKKLNMLTEHTCSIVGHNIIYRMNLV